MSGGPLRILQLLTHHRIHSGGAIQAFLLARALVRRGHDVTFAVCERHGEMDPATRARVLAIGCRYEGHALSARRSIGTIRESLRRGAFDVVHVHREVALERFLQAARRGPEVGAVANVGTSKPPDRAQAKRLRSPLLDRVVVVAEALKELLVCTAGLEPTKVEVVLGAYDEERFRDDARPTPRSALLPDGAPVDAPLVGCLANLDPKKGHDVLARAAAIVHRARPDARFLLAGKGDAETARRLAAAAGLPPDVMLPLGFVDDVPGFLKALDVSVSASTRGEGLTGAVRESLALGAPVVCTAVAGNVELVRHRATGLAVPPGDPDALARAILDCLDDPAAARLRADRGRDLVVGRLTSARRAERMESLYRDVTRWRDVRRGPVDRFLFPDPGGEPAEGTAAKSNRAARGGGAPGGLRPGENDPGRHEPGTGGQDTGGPDSDRRDADGTGRDGPNRGDAGARRAVIADRGPTGAPEGAR